MSPPLPLTPACALETALVSRMPLRLCGTLYNSSVTSSGWEVTSVLRVYSVSCAGLTALDVYMDSATVLTGAEDGSAFLSNVQSGRILGQLHGMRSHSHPVALRIHETHIWQVPAQRRVLYSDRVASYAYRLSLDGHCSMCGQVAGNCGRY